MTALRFCSTPRSTVRRFLFNATKYSQTTTTHQNALRAYMYSDGYNLTVHDDVPRGTPYHF
jgi:hypothetical protein